MHPKTLLTLLLPLLTSLPTTTAIPSNPAPTPPPSLPRRQDTKSATTTTTSLDCYTTITTTATVCAGTPRVCAPTQVAFPSCAPGLRCLLDANRAPICYRPGPDTLTTSGLVVAILFGTGTLVATVLICFFCVRDRRRDRRLRQAVEVAVAAKMPPPPVVQEEAVEEREGMIDDRRQYGRDSRGPAAVGYGQQDPFGDYREVERYDDPGQQYQNQGQYRDPR